MEGQEIFIWERDYKIVYLSIGLVVLVVLGFSWIYSVAYKCVIACREAEKAVLDGDSNSVEDTIRTLNMIKAAHKLGFEKNTHRMSREVYQLWRGKYYNTAKELGLL